MKTLLVVVTSVVVLSLGGFEIYAYHSEIDSIETSSSQPFDADIAEQGRVLAAAGQMSQADVNTIYACIMSDKSAWADLETRISTNQNALSVTG